MSDTHGNTAAIQGLLSIYQNQVDAVIHLGDNAQDMQRFVSTDKNSDTFYMVNGNMDSESDDIKERVVEIAGKRIFITHGHHYNVKSKLDNIIYKAQELQVNACLFGHTHNPIMFKQEGILFLNPGSLTYPCPGTERSYGLIFISEDKGINGALFSYKEAATCQEK